MRELTKKVWYDGLLTALTLCAFAALALVAWPFHQHWFGKAMVSAFAGASLAQLYLLLLILAFRFYIKPSINDEKVVKYATGHYEQEITGIKRAIFLGSTTFLLANVSLWGYDVLPGGELRWCSAFITLFFAGLTILCMIAAMSQPPKQIRII